MKPRTSIMLFAGICFAVIALMGTIKAQTGQDTTSKKIPADFKKFLASFVKTMRAENYNMALRFFSFKQGKFQFCYGVVDRSELLSTFKEYFPNHKWKNPKIHFQTRQIRDSNNKPVTYEGIMVDYIEDDIGFFFVKSGKSYIVDYTQCNYEGGD